MSVEHDRMIAFAREEHDYQCARCRYSLAGVPLNNEELIVCPECGYVMRFRVSVQLISDDPEYQQKVKRSLNRMDRILSRIALSMVLIAMTAVILYLLF